MGTPVPGDVEARGLLEAPAGWRVHLRLGALGLVKL